MEKGKKFLVSLLVISLSLNLILCIRYYKFTQNIQQQVNELCGTITLLSIEASSRLDEALETNNRRFALMAGIKLEQLSGLLGSSISFELGVHNTYGSGSLSSLAELIIWGNPTLEFSPLGSPNESTPFSTSEIAVMENISAGLKKFALSFYSESATENTYMNEPRSYSNIGAVNLALLTLQNATKDIFDAQ